MSLPGDPDVIIDLGGGGAFVVNDSGQLLGLPTTGAGAGSLIVNNRVLVRSRVDAGTQRLSLEALTPVRVGPGPYMAEVDYDVTTGELILTTASGAGRALDSLSLEGAEVLLAPRAVGQGGDLLQITDGNLNSAFRVTVGSGDVFLGTDQGLRLRGHTGSAVTLSGPTLVTYALEVDRQVSVLTGDLNMDAGSLSARRWREARLELVSTASGARFDLIVTTGTGTGARPQSLYIRGPGSVLNDVYAQISRNVVTSGGVAVARISNLVFLGGFGRNGSVVGDSGLRTRAAGRTDLLASSPSTGNLALLRTDATPEVLMGANILTGVLPTAGVVELDVSAGGSLLFGTYGKPLGTAGPATFNERFRVDDTGEMVLHAPTSTGSPGTQPILRLTPSVVEATLHVGDALRGTMHLKAEGGRPGLLAHQADDGQTVYWAAWRDGANVVLKASLTPPTSIADGEDVVVLP